VPIYQRRDRDEARRRLTQWLAARLPGATDLWVSPLGGPAATGFSNETILFDAAWRADGVDHARSLAIRVKPTVHTVFLDSVFDDQFRVIKALSERTDIPVPPVYWFEPEDWVLGSPFFVMGRVDGTVPGDAPPYTQSGWLYDATPQQQEQLFWDALDVMARIHRLDWRRLGLGCVDRRDLGPSGLDQQLVYNQKYFEWAARGRPQPVVEAAWAWLLAHRPEETGPDALCWGDSRIGNMIFADFKVRAVLDWEMVTIGHPVRDLGWWLFLDRFHSGIDGADRLPGFPCYDATVTRWEELSGRRADNLAWYEVFAGFQFGVVMIRLGQLMVQFELLPPESDYERDNPVTQLLDALLATV
jgi:aminoglycoside phosphotransferase (APT) family kinase protein